MSGGNILSGRCDEGKCAYHRHICGDLNYIESFGGCLWIELGFMCVVVSQAKQVDGVEDCKCDGGMATKKCQSLAKNFGYWLIVGEDKKKGGGKAGNISS